MGKLSVVGVNLFLLIYINARESYQIFLSYHPPEQALLVLEACEGCIHNRTRPHKPRCEASCWGLHGTGVVIIQCLERSPRGTRQHPVVFTPSTLMGCCGWRPFKFPRLMGKWKKKVAMPLNWRGTPFQGDPYEKCFSRVLEDLVKH
jgi:hypothetical protein